jgi:hypothetical protein
MSKFVPFTVYVKVVPARAGKRWEYMRDLQKMAVLVFDKLITLEGFQFATPGGGQAQQMGDIQRRGALGSFANGTAVTPQFGQTPAQLKIAGFYLSTASNLQQYANTQRISAGVVYSGPDSHSNDGMPVATINNEAKTVRDTLRTAIAEALPAGTVFSIFKLDYSGVVYGDRGFHFPQ